jgi:hypothetical protein
MLVCGRRMLVSLHRLFVGGLMVAIGMVLGCCVVGFRCMFMVFSCLLMCVMCHRNHLFEASFTTPRPYATSTPGSFCFVLNSSQITPRAVASKQSPPGEDPLDRQIRLL